MAALDNPVDRSKVKICVGTVSGPKGLDGSLRIRSYTTQPEDITSYGPVSDKTEKNHYDIHILQSTKKGLVVKISGIEDRDAAEAIKGLDLYVSRGSLPELDEGEFYFSDLIGLDAVNLNGSLIGKVKSVDNFGAGNVMELEMRDGNFRSLPFSLDVVPVVDIAGGRVVVKPPTELDIEDAADVMETG